MTTNITRHLDASTLMSFASGGLPEPLAAVASAHLALCSQCRSEMRVLELLGGAVFDQQLGARLTADIALPQMPQVENAPVQKMTAGNAPRSNPLPPPIAERYGISLDTIPWKRLAPGVMHHRLALSPGTDGDLRLLKIAAGARMPEHGHGGGELTLVLDGAYADETSEYRRGDIQDVSDDIEHRPIANKETGCICLIASERPARFKGFLGRLLQPWTGM